MSANLDKLVTDITDNIHNDVYPAIDPTTTLKGSCTGKTVLITGAGRGIGKATAVAFALAGASTIIITARSTFELAEARVEIMAAGKGVEVITHTTDITSEDSVKNLFEMLKARNVILDVLINNAGLCETPILAHEGEPATWWKTWEVNVKGTYLLTHFALQGLRADAPFTLICTSSAGSLFSMGGFSAYSPSKAAVNRFVEFIDIEYAARGVRAFAIHPGGVATKLALDAAPAQHRELLKTKLVQTPELAAGFCVWLASQSAADHFKGKYVSSMWDVDAIVATAEAKSPEEKRRWLTSKLVV